MSSWPETMKVGPIGDWPEDFTRERRPAPFRATLSNTLALLRREIYNLVDTKVQQDFAELLVAIPAGAFRIDGRPYANAKAEHPGVIFSIDSRNGHLSYPCDTFTSWEDNLRAIALALEALRKVDRYGVSKSGKQYRGYLAIEATATPAGFADRQDALMFLARVTGLPYMDHPVSGLLRRAQQKTHPDMPGGSATDFQRVSLAEAKLREAGVL